MTGALQSRWSLQKRNHEQSLLLFTKKWPWAIHSRCSLQKTDRSDLLFSKSESLFRSFAHKKQVICSKNQRANSQPWVYVTSSVPQSSNLLVRLPDGGRHTIMVAHVMKCRRTYIQYTTPRKCRNHFGKTLMALLTWSQLETGGDYADQYTCLPPCGASFQKGDWNPLLSLETQYMPTFILHTVRILLRNQSNLVEEVCLEVGSGHRTRNGELEYCLKFFNR